MNNDFWNKRIPIVAAWICSLAWVISAQPQPGYPQWSSNSFHDSTIWPQAGKNPSTTLSSEGMRVTVTAGHTFAIAATTPVLLPGNFGRIRIHTAQCNGGARWFIRLYGELRIPGQRHTASIAQDETATGERTFDVDPRLHSLAGAPLQLQLGVEGKPGATVLFDAVDFLPPPSLANRQHTHRPQPGQKEIKAVEFMPNLPEPFEMIDWRQKARDYDQFVFNFKATGDFLPLVWLDHSALNLNRDTFGLPSYVGTPDQCAAKTNSQEGITCMGAVLSATLAGMDKSRQEHDFVAMCEAWFNTNNKLDLVLNRQRDGAGGSFWYELMPHIVFYGLADCYTNHPRLAEIMAITADRWHQVCLDLANSNGIPDFNHTSFNFRTRKPVDNGKWKEPDAAAGVAWLQYAAWNKFKQSNHLAAADNCLRFLQESKNNPYYEVLLPYGALTAARMNAEQGRNYDMDKLINWCFGVSDCRGGWGVTLGRWGDYDCDGLVGSIDNRGGYAFAMNTFVQAGAIVPIARYDTRYARAIGKWMLNLANAARLFYPGALPSGHESSAFWKGDPRHVIAYEGLRYEWLGKRPCATGDPVAMQWGPKTDLGLYGSSYAGILGALVRPTSEPRILLLDCLATDFFRPKAWPTYLCYNPFPQKRSFDVNVGPLPSDLFNAVTGEFMKRNVRNQTRLTLDADTAAVIVIVPANSKARVSGKQTMIGEITVQFSPSSNAAAR